MAVPPLRPTSLFLTDRLGRNWLEKLRWATGSLCTWQGDMDLVWP